MDTCRRGSSRPLGRHTPEPILKVGSHLEIGYLESRVCSESAGSTAFIIGGPKHAPTSDDTPIKKKRQREQWRQDEGQARPAC